MLCAAVVTTGLMGASGGNCAGEPAPELELGAPQDAQNFWPSTSWAPQTWQYATATSGLAVPPPYKWRRGDTSLVNENRDRYQDGIVEKVRHDRTHQFAVLLKGPRDEEPKGNGENKSDAVVHVITGAQDQTQDQ
jgi:hypothetical protein